MDCVLFTEAVLDVTDDGDALANVEMFISSAVFVELMVNVESLTEVVVVVVGVVGVGGDIIVVLVVPVVVMVALAIQIQN